MSAPGNPAGLNAEQLANARTIVGEVQNLGLPERAAEIALMTGETESSLHNYTTATDHDSLGVFQQRPSTGWGTPAQVTDVAHATDSFLARLVQVPDWQGIAPWAAAQAVQISAYPDGSNYEANWSSMQAEADALYGAPGQQVSGGATQAPVSSTSTPAASSGGATATLTSLTNLLPWNWGSDLSKAQGAIVSSVAALVVKTAFIGGGLGLILLGAYRAAAPARQNVETTLAPLAAAAAV